MQSPEQQDGGCRQILGVKVGIYRVFTAERNIQQSAARATNSFPTPVCNALSFATRYPSTFLDAGLLLLWPFLS